jgi:sporulation protein YlmC with PRC-barrel domain
MPHDRLLSMLRSCKSLEGYSLNASDGEIGHLKTIHFNDEDWSVKYLVVDIGSFWNEKKVLVLPNASYQFSWIEQNISVKLTRNQIKEALPYSSDLPVSDQHELINKLNFKSLYLIEPWSGSFLPLWFPDLKAGQALQNIVQEIGDKDLRCAKTITGYQVVLKDKEFGKVEDFILDCNEWIIRDIVIDANHILHSNKKIIPVSKIKVFDTDNQKIELELSSHELLDYTDYNEHQAVNREYVIKFYDYYGRLKYTDKVSYEDYKKLDEKLERLV